MDDEIGPPLAGHEDFVRYFSAMKFDDGRLVTGALKIPPNHKNKMSVQRLHVYSDNEDEDIREIRARSRLDLKKSGHFVRWNTAAFLAAAAQEPTFADLSPVCNPLHETDTWPRDDAHALIQNMPEEDLMLDLLLDLVRNEVIARYPGKV